MTTNRDHKPRDPRRVGVDLTTAMDVLGIHQPDVPRAIRGRTTKSGKPSTHTRMLAMFVAALEALPVPAEREKFYARIAELSKVREGDEEPNPSD